MLDLAVPPMHVLAVLQMHDPVGHAMSALVVRVMLDRADLSMLDQAVHEMPALADPPMLVRVVLPTLVPADHAMLVQVDHVIHAPVADGIAQPFAADTSCLL